MPCTTILVGKKASYDGSTMIARTDDGFYDVKKMKVMQPEEQPRKYKSVIGHLEIELPDDPIRYCYFPNVDTKNGTWPGSGINDANVGMTATETITSNPRVLGADPLVEYVKADKEGEEDIPGGIGEEDLVTLVLPYVRTAKEGAARLGMLLEKYGTYESNGIAFNDENECWWLESIGGHHWMARRVPDEVVVIMPNQFGMDSFDFEDALGAQRWFMCSPDLVDFMKENHLDLNNDSTLNPRNIFGSRTDQDHEYNTPRAWFMGRYLCPSIGWDGPNARYNPTSDDIPWALVPERKVTVEDVKYMLSSTYQGTPYNPYSTRDYLEKGLYRTIGIARTGFASVMQIRGYMPDEIKGVLWLCFGSTTFDALLPVYALVDRIPAYISDITLDVDSNNFYWVSRLIGALADAHYGDCIQQIERYQDAVACGSHRILGEYDKKMISSGDFSLKDEANEKLCEMAKKESTKALNNVTHTASLQMKNNYSRKDN